MKYFVQLAVGLLSALGMVVIVFGALLLSLSEDASFIGLVSSPSAAASPTEATSQVQPLPGITLVVGTPSPTPPGSGATQCPPPAGWQLYTVTAEDQLDALAAQAGVSTQEVVKANCLISASLLPGTLLYLPLSATLEPSLTPPPALPTVEIASATVSATPTLTAVAKPACGPFRGWVLYSVQPSDTLYKLSQAFGVSIGHLQQANCLSGTLIRAGTRLYVPNVATRTPNVTATVTQAPSTTPEQPSPTVSITQLPSETMVPTSQTPTETPTETATEIPTETPTNTLSPVVPDANASTTPEPASP